MSKSTAEIRQAFLDFFHSKGHQIIASSSLVPNNDPTLLFTNAGMNQFKDVFLGIDKPNYSCVTTSQRCVRAGGKHNDLENVGYTARHHTFFEMLGNFSFGEYFKREAIQYAWELLTSKNWFNIPKERLWMTVHKTDCETYKIWRKEIGVPQERIIRIGSNKKELCTSENFWKMGNTGPCGPCTEIFYDHGDHIWGGPPGSKEENGDRYVEIWNIVFMQFNRQGDGTIEPLPKPSVDTGMGLERISAVLQHVNSNYEIDLFRTLIEEIAEVIGVTKLRNKSLCVIADHIRSCAFLISDGVIPSNESRGYVLRRIIRRAIRHGSMLNVKEVFFYKLVECLIGVMGLAGNELKCKQMLVEKILRAEEEQFSCTLKRGLMLLNEELAKLKSDTLDGSTVFRLYDTYGFPVDLTIDICHERNIKVDEAGFKIAMEKQRHRAQKTSYFNVNYNKAIHINGITKFEGYDHLELNGRVTALFVDGKAVDNISTDQNAIIILDKTPFYAESGGQVGDKGKLKGNGFSFTVSDTQKYGQAIGHIGKLTFGSIKVDENILAKVDESRRTRICLNHSATHLMYAALREILGTHVEQRGSLVNDKTLRFDFSHYGIVKPSEISAIEDLVNAKIRRNMLIETTAMNLDTAREKGVIALSKEKYSEHVRVLSLGDFSTELCCGTHASRTGDIGLFRIVSESSIAAGIRRIEAVTGESAIESLHVQSNQLREIVQLLKSDGQDLSEKLRNMLEYIRQLEKECYKLKEKIAMQESMNLSKKTIEIKGIKLLVSELAEIEPKILHTIVNRLKNQLAPTIVVLATIVKDRISMVAGVSKDVTDRVKAGELISMVAQQVGGKGGGRPDIAHAGGTNVAALSAALASIEGWVSIKL